MKAAPADHTRHADVAAAVRELLPRVLQGNVQRIDSYANAGRYIVRLDGARLTVICEVEVVDGKLWTHLSVGGGLVNRLPTWKELRWCKEYFLGDRRAIQVLPPRAEYVNIHPHVLHLYAPLEGEPIPDFRGAQEDGSLAI